MTDDDDGPIDDLAAVAGRINKRLNDLYFNETHKAMAIGVWRPGAYVHEGGNLVVVVYDPLQDDVFYLLKERSARAYDRWLAAGNVGRHYEGDALREEIAREIKR